MSAENEFEYQLHYKYKVTGAPFSHTQEEMSDPDFWSGEQIFLFSTDKELGQVYDSFGAPTKDTETIKEELYEVYRELYRQTGHDGIAFISLGRVGYGDKDDN